LEIEMTIESTFSRDSLDAYEAQPAKVVPDNVPPTEKPLNIVTPSAEETATEVADPSGDEGNTDPTVSEDGTSDENADPSTAVVEPGDESETVEGEEAAAGDEAPAATPAPKKGSAAARIQELLDLNEGYKEYGKLREKEATELRELLKARDTKAAPAPVAPPAEKPSRMPRLEDEDIGFDADKLEVKMQEWIRSESRKAAAETLRETTQKSDTQKTVDAFNERLTTFAADHADFETVVLKNPVLNANQLSKEASAALVKSPLSADIMYHFGQNPDLAIEVAKLPVAEQLLRLGEISAEVKASKASTKPTTPAKKTPAAPANGAKPKSLSNAPPPPTAIKAAGRPAARDETDPNMGMDEFARQHREKKQARRAEFTRVVSQRGGR
jgi:hypothetical protein